MARGWESKSVAEDQAERRDTRSERPPETAAEIARRTRRQGLELSRARVVAELAATTAPVRRAALEGALAQLDAELAAVASGAAAGDPAAPPRHGS